MFCRKLIAAFALICLLALPAAAQEQAVLSLQTGTTMLQTGQEYDVTIRLDGVTDLWLANVEIQYDPALLYIIGTKAGSPVHQGALFAPAETSVVVRNKVERNSLLYTLSMLAPANPVSGSGDIGTFRVYPLAPGTARLSFTRAELTRVSFTGEGENRIGGNPQAIPFAPVYLDLTISGSPVQPPSEATATPAPTDTPEARVGQNLPTAEATLVNLAAAPTPAASPAPVGDNAPVSSPLLLAAIGLMLIGAIGLIVVIVLARRRR
jgi:hypothetical protein